MFSVIDAAGKPGDHILQGNFWWLGSYSYCNGIVATETDKKNVTHELYRGQYCIAVLVKPKTKVRAILLLCYYNDVRMTSEIECVLHNTLS